MTEKDFMKQALNTYFLPELRKKGFVGEFPHYRRIKEDVVYVLSIVFDQWGGSFALELSYALLNQAETNLFNPRDALYPETITALKCVNRKRMPLEGEWIYFCDLIKIKSNAGESIYSLTKKQKDILLKKTPAENISVVEEVGDGIYCRSAMTAAKFLKNADVWWDKQTTPKIVEEMNSHAISIDLNEIPKETAKKRWGIFNIVKKKN